VVFLQRIPISEKKIKPNHVFWHTYRVQDENTPRETGGVDLVVS
jgi:hypothetical protein